jgi:hypothetical protein
MGEATYKLDSGTLMRMKDVLYVPGLKKNLLSISSLDKKGFRSPCELWQRRLAHINYKALPYISKVVTGLPKLKVDHEGVSKGCA